MVFYFKLLAGHIAAWEVEKMAKDFGWVMQAQVLALLFLFGRGGK